MMADLTSERLIDIINLMSFDSFLPTVNQSNLYNDASSPLEELNRQCKILLNKESSDHILRSLLNREVLLKIIESVQEGIQVVDSHGIIRYVNSAFLNITGLKIYDRIGKNIYEVSPDGSLATVLTTKKPVNNVRNHPIGTPIELLSSAVPIYIFNKIVGAIAIIQDMQEVFKLTEQLKNTEAKFEHLSEKIKYLCNASYTFEDLIGNSLSMQHVLEMGHIAAKNDSVVLIQGETGTGKEIIANAIHYASARIKKQFVSVNCSAIPQQLLESEFFGHEKGSFTGAYKRKLGKFEVANGGTLFLDEIGDMDLLLQAKILRAIQEKEIQRVGGEDKIPLNVRIIAATNRNLKKMVENGAFRVDLFYRLNVWNIVIPPLRERKEDIDILIDFLLIKICRRIGKKGVIFSSKAKQILYKYDWPGNVRELENVIERALLSSRDRLKIEAEDLKFISIDDNSALTGT